eukprot:ANDGO_03815.mRNA.1 hypothetical protein GUITHDRAFT_175417
MEPEKELSKSFGGQSFMQRAQPSPTVRNFRIDLEGRQEQAVRCTATASPFLPSPFLNSAVSRGITPRTFSYESLCLETPKPQIARQSQRIPDVSLSVFLLGDSSVGKSTIRKRFAERPSSTSATAPPSFSILTSPSTFAVPKRFERDNLSFVATTVDIQRGSCLLRAHIKDFCAAPRFKVVNQAYFRKGCDAAIIVVDGTASDMMERAVFWKEKVDNAFFFCGADLGKFVPCSLFVNKVDRLHDDEIELLKPKLQQLVTRHGFIDYHLVSATRDLLTIHEAFENIVDITVVEDLKNLQIDTRPSLGAESRERARCSLSSSIDTSMSSPKSPEQRAVGEGKAKKRQEMLFGDLWSPKETPTTERTGTLSPTWEESPVNPLAFPGATEEEECYSEHANPLHAGHLAANEIVPQCSAQLPGPCQPQRFFWGCWKQNRLQTAGQAERVM